ncbi:MAG: M56 family metallopeptidase [Gemmatimonadaceae bacterium]
MWDLIQHFDPMFTIPLAFLGDLALRVALILALTGLVSVVLRRHSAGKRHLALTLAALGALVLPVVAAWGPEWRLAVLSDSPADARVAPGAPAPAPAPIPVALAAPKIVTSGVPAGATTGAEPVFVRSVSDLAETRMPPAYALAAIWLAGALLVLGRLALGVVRRRRLAGYADAVLPPLWERARRRVFHSGLLPARVRVLASSRSDMPMTWGIIHPIIVVPDRSAWTDEERVAALLHEAAHVRRGDSVIQFLMAMLRALHWYNPLVWWVSREERLTREEACDDLVLAAGIKPSQYAEQLLGIVRLTERERLPVAALSMARRSSLAERLTAILRADQRRDRPGWWARVGLVSGAVAISGTLAAATPVARTNEGIDVIGPASTVAEVPTQGVTVLPTLRSIGEEREPVTRPDSVTLPEEGTPMQSLGDAPPLATITSSVRSPVAAGVLRPPVGATGAPQQPACLSRRSGNTSLHSSTDDNERRRVLWKTGGCEIEINARGRFRLAPTLDDLQSIAGGGYFELREDDGSTEREVRITTGADGRLTHDYKVNNQRRAWDADGAAWFKRVVVALDRRTAWAADVRIPALLQQGGVDAVLAEIELMEGDYARRIYFTRLAATATLTSAQLTRVIESAGNKIESDYEMAELLIAASKQPSFDNRAQLALATAASRIRSSYEKRRAFTALLARDGLSTATVGAMLAGTRNMESDYELAELLIEVSRRYAIQPTTRQYYFDALATIESDYEYRRVLSALLRSAPLPAEQVQHILRHAGANMGGYELAELLVAMTRAASRLDLPTATAVLIAMRSVDSDYERARVMKEMVRQSPDTQAIELMLTDARRLGSSYERAEFLVAVAAKYSIEGRLRDSYVAAAESIDSDHDRGRALAAAFRRRSAR